jgi:hypothetical protein
MLLKFPKTTDLRGGFYQQLIAFEYAIAKKWAKANGQVLRDKNRPTVGEWCLRLKSPQLMCEGCVALDARIEHYEKLVRMIRPAIARWNCKCHRDGEHRESGASSRASAGGQVIVRGAALSQQCASKRTSPRAAFQSRAPRR